MSDGALTDAQCRSIQTAIANGASVSYAAFLNGLSPEQVQVALDTVVPEVSPDPTPEPVDKKVPRPREEVPSGWDGSDWQQTFTHLSGIEEGLPGPVVAAADGALSLGVLSFAYVATNGAWASWSGVVDRRATSNTAEAAALGQALLVPRIQAVVCDSLGLVAKVEKWRRTSSDTGTPLGELGTVVDDLRARVREHPQVAISWVQGHAGHPLNEAADRLCQIARRTRVGSLRPEEGQDKSAQRVQLYLGKWRRSLAYQSRGSA